MLSAQDRKNIAATREARFTVSEATWINLDVSSDKIFFEVLGHLYAIPVTGGVATQITTDPSVNRFPTVSPDGRKLAFISDRSGNANLWIANIDGSNARQLSHLGSSNFDRGIAFPVWSPDGEFILVMQERKAAGFEGPDGLRPVRYDVATGQMTWVPETGERLATYFHGGFDSDPHYILVPAAPTATEGRDHYAHLLRLNLVTGGASRPMGLFSDRTVMAAAVSKDRKLLAYIAPTQDGLGLRLRDLATGDDRWLIRDGLDSSPKFNGEWQNELFPTFSFSADAKFVFLPGRGHILRVAVSDGAVAQIPFTVDVRRPLKPLGLTEYRLEDKEGRARAILQPAISPDGRRVAFSALRHVWWMDLPANGNRGSQPHRLTSSSTVAEYFPAWSPDGRWIAFATWQDGRGGTIRRANVGVAPSQTQTLTSGAAIYSQLAVGPDGLQVAAVRTEVEDLSGVNVSDYPQGDAPCVIRLDSGGQSPAVPLSQPGINLGWMVNEQLYFAGDPTRLYLGNRAISWDGDVNACPSKISKRNYPAGFNGVLSPQANVALAADPNNRFALLAIAASQFIESASDPSPHADKPEPADMLLAPTIPTQSISWAADGKTALVGQAGTLLLVQISHGRIASSTTISVNLPIEIDRPIGTLALRGARLITMLGDEVIENGDIVITDNRITALGATGQVQIPSSAHIVDVHGETIIPGYVDTHDHLRIPTGVQSDQEWRFLVRLAFGTTSTREALDSGGVINYVDAERSGLQIGPRLFSVGSGYPYFDATTPPLTTIEAARKVAHLYRDFYRTENFKYYNNNGSRIELDALSDAFREFGLNATAHSAGVVMPLQLITDGFAGVEHGYGIQAYDDVAHLFAVSGTTLTHTFTQVSGATQFAFDALGNPLTNASWLAFVPLAEREEACLNCQERDYYGGHPELTELKRRLSLPARIAYFGGYSGVGGHGDIQGISIHYEMWLYHLGGMPNHEILRAATLNGARAIGYERELGSLEVGKLADLQVLDKNPVEDIGNTLSIHYVMKNGRLYHARDLTEVWPRQRVLPAIYRHTQQ